MQLLFAISRVTANCALTSASIHLASSHANFIPGLSQERLSLLQVITLGVILALTYELVIYRLLLDPLRKYPVIDILDIRILLPVTNVSRGEQALRWAKLHRSEDAIRVRVSGTTTVLVPLSPQALRDVLTTHQQDFEKPSGGRHYLARLLGYGLILSEGPIHARQRKQLTSSFKIQNIRALHGLMLQKTNILLRCMEDDVKGNGHCDITEWASRVTLDIIGVSLMSQEFDSLNNKHQPVNDAFARLTASNPGQTMLFALSILLPQAMVASIPSRTNTMIKENVAIVRGNCEKALAEVYSSLDKDDNKDILASIAKDQDASKKEVIDQMVTFLGAGHETTATSIAWATHLLTLPEYKHYQDKLRGEILEHSDCIDRPTLLETLPWLNAICEETLRLYPPVTTTARIAVRDTVMAGTPVPKNTMITLFPWAINRNPRYWGGEEAEKFVPERWIETREDGTLRMNKHGGAESNFCEMTFLHGIRSCIGRDFAKAELRCVLACMYSRYRVSRLPGDDGEVTPAGSITIKPAGGLFVSMKPAK